MDTASKKILESATLSTLHAQQFSRSSTQAHLLLTDLLSRYITLLSSTCAKYAQHAGRVGVTAKDAAAALEELGVGVEELTEYWETEGRDMARFGYSGQMSRTQRRQEELTEMRAALDVGRKEDQDDMVPLIYMPVEEEMFYSDELSGLLDEAFASEELESDSDDSSLHSPDHQDDLMDVDPLSKPLVQSPIEEQMSVSRLESERVHSPLPPALPSPLPIPDTQPALFGAYHHILTHKPSEIAPPPSQGRYKVALALVGQSENVTNPKWEPSPSLYGTSAPNTPRVATIGPTHPIIAGKEDGKGKEREGADSAAEAKLPSMPTRPLPSFDRVAPLVSTSRSRIPQLAKQLLSNPVHNRTTRLGHPPALIRGTTKLVYGPGVPAPWNSSSIPPPLPTASKPNGKEVNGKDKDKDKDDAVSAAKLLPDARLFATWNWDQKSYKEPLQAHRRGRMGSVAGSVHIVRFENEEDEWHVPQIFEKVALAEFKHESLTSMR
ncbi:hypothetical protein EUX98_g8404 [Antrodiella citrinella]|uniref:Bromodomain associated domain-containing protein n=1 Tax=Antrodiella citrinella TaxID=2447956 RepID=A0A4S4M7R3_9APHY|nr:hypothetical protein EUX98_g8404 [Antrodiella citrinella]